MCAATKNLCKPDVETEKEKKDNESIFGDSMQSLAAGQLTSRHDGNLKLYSTLFLALD